MTRNKQCTRGVASVAPTSLTDAQIDAIWDSVPPQGDPTGHKFARAFARAVLGACSGPNSGCVADCETHPACMFKATGGVASDAPVQYTGDDVNKPAAGADELMAQIYLYGQHCAEHPEDLKGATERLRSIKAHVSGVARLDGSTFGPHTPMDSEPTK